MKIPSSKNTAINEDREVLNREVERSSSAISKQDHANGS